MEYVAYIFGTAWQLLNLPFNLFGHSLSLGQVFIWSGVAGIAVNFVAGGLLNE